MNRRLIVVRDSRAEGWPSMDLCADALVGELRSRSDVSVTDHEAQFHKRFSRLPFLGRTKLALNADRAWHRHITVNRSIRPLSKTGDIVHVVDHSYAHACLSVDPQRCGVYCHDLDAFRSILSPKEDPRPWWFRQLARRTWQGMLSAAVVFHNSKVVGEQLAQWIDRSKLVHAPLGVASEFLETRAETDVPSDLIDRPYLLHVGSHLPRKRIDVLIEVFARIASARPDLILVQVGPPFNAGISSRIARHDLGDRILQRTNLTRNELATLYRRAEAVLVPSESEGFGLPVIEALATGVGVLASDIPVLREVGGSVVDYCRVGDVDHWERCLNRVLSAPRRAEYIAARRKHAGQFSWTNHAKIISTTYQRLCP